MRFDCADLANQWDHLESIRTRLWEGRLTLRKDIDDPTIKQIVDVVHAILGRFVGCGLKLLDFEPFTQRPVTKFSILCFRRSRNFIAVKSRRLRNSSSFACLICLAYCCKIAGVITASDLGVFFPFLAKYWQNFWKPLTSYRIENRALPICVQEVQNSLHQIAQIPNHTVG